jgi:hypothetical protein
MKFSKWLVVCFFSVSVIFSYFTYNVLNAQSTPSYLNSKNFYTQPKSTSKTIKVDGVEYLVVETNNGVGVTLKLNKSNLRKLAEMVSEISDEMDAEKFNNIIQGK